MRSAPILASDDNLRLRGGLALLAPVRLDHAPRLLPVNSIRPNPGQPRKHVDKAGIEKLAASLREHDLLQPIVVRPLGGPRSLDSDAAYQLISGERRWRAAKLAGLSEIPAIIRSVADDQMLELSLVENLQREDLNPIEKARAYQALHVERGLSHEEIGRRMGEDRKTVGNSIRLLELGEVALRLVESGGLTASHGKALLAVDDPEAQAVLAANAAALTWSLNYLQRQIRTRNRKGSARRLANSQRAAELQNLLLQALNLRTTLLARRRALVASIRLDCESQETMERAISWLSRAIEVVK